MDSITQKQVEQWLRDGTISEEQANKMLTDSAKLQKEERSHKLMSAVPIIGSALLGVGAMFFVVSNWLVIPSIARVLIFVGSTFCAYFAGYYFQYYRQNLPKIGAALLFLSTIFFGVTILLIAQTYNVEVNNHVLILVWFFGILPLVYGLSSPSIGILTVLLFCVWIELFVFQGSWFEKSQEDFIRALVLYFISGVFVFSLGVLHSWKESMKKVAYAYQIMGIKIAMISLFLLTFERVFQSLQYRDALLQSLENFDRFALTFIIVTAFTIFLIIAGLVSYSVKSGASVLENFFALGLAVIAALFFFFSSPEVFHGSKNMYVLGFKRVYVDAYTILFNVVFVGAAIALLFGGYRRGNMYIVSTGIFWLSVFTVARYIKPFWDPLAQSLFFMVGGLILVLGGVALERKRKKLTAALASTTPTINQ